MKYPVIPLNCFLKTNRTNWETQDRFVSVKDDGSFTYNLRLNDGENTLTIIARDAAGNETKLERKVTYQP